MQNIMNNMNSNGFESDMTFSVFNEGKIPDVICFIWMFRIALSKKKIFFKNEKSSFE